MARIAFIGLGVMGYPMAGHLKRKGDHDVTVYNRTATKAAAWVKEYGGGSAPTLREAARDADLVFSCVGNDDHAGGAVLRPVAIARRRAVGFFQPDPLASEGLGWRK